MTPFIENLDDSEKDDSENRILKRSPLFWIAQKLLIRNFSYPSASLMKEVLSEQPQVIHFVSHSSMLGWLSAFSVLFPELERLGFGERKSHVVFNPFLLKIPVVLSIAKIFFRSEVHRDYGEILKHLKEKKIADLFIYPEGANCVFGRLNEIRPFFSPMSIDMAFRTKLPLIITVQKGAEHWAKLIKLNPLIFTALEKINDEHWRKFFLNKSRTLDLLSQSPYFSFFHLPMRVKKLQLLSEVYPLDYDTYDAIDPMKKAEFLKEQTELIRQRMQEMYDSLQEEKAGFFSWPFSR